MTSRRPEQLVFAAIDALAMVVAVCEVEEAALAHATLGQIAGGVGRAASRAGRYMRAELTAPGHDADATAWSEALDHGVASDIPDLVWARLEVDRADGYLDLAVSAIRSGSRHSDAAVDLFVDAILHDTQPSDVAWSQLEAAVSPTRAREIMVQIASRLHECPPTVGLRVSASLAAHWRDALDRVPVEVLETLLTAALDANDVRTLHPAWVPRCLRAMDADVRRLSAQQITHLLALDPEPNRAQLELLEFLLLEFEPPIITSDWLNAKVTDVSDEVAVLLAAAMIEEDTNGVRQLREPMASRLDGLASGSLRVRCDAAILRADLEPAGATRELVELLRQLADEEPSRVVKLLSRGLAIPISGADRSDVLSEAARRLAQLGNVRDLRVALELAKQPPDPERLWLLALAADGLGPDDVHIAVGELRRVDGIDADAIRRAIVRAIRSGVVLYRDTLGELDTAVRQVLERLLGDDGTLSRE